MKEHAIEDIALQEVGVQAIDGARHHPHSGDRSRRPQAPYPSSRNDERGDDGHSDQRDPFVLAPGG